MLYRDCNVQFVVWVLSNMLSTTCNCTKKKKNDCIHAWKNYEYLGCI